MPKRPQEWPEPEQDACVDCAHYVLDNDCRLPLPEDYCNSPALVEVRFNRITGARVPQSMKCANLRTEDTCKGFEQKVTEEA